MRGLNKLSRCVMATLLAAMLFAGVLPPSGAQGKKDLVDTMIAVGLNGVMQSIRAAGLVGAFRRPGPFTIFAPSDEAFDALPRGVFNMVLRDRQKIAAVVAYHVVPGRLSVADVARATSLKTFEGESLAIRVAAGSPRINGARIIRSNIAAINGTIHVIDRILIPRGR
jgi:uncharacterized surface protein with fasciclin (FAS1) repeats